MQRYIRNRQQRGGELEGFHQNSRVAIEEVTGTKGEEQDFLSEKESQVHQKRLHDVGKACHNSLQITRNNYTIFIGFREW